MSDENEEISVEVEGAAVAAPVDENSDIVDDDELGQYSSRVQNRIKKLTEKHRREQRDREEAQRLAQTLLEQNRALQERVKGLDTGYMSEYGTRLEAQSAAAKEAFKKAYESGDPDAIAAAQEQMAKIAIDQERFRIAKNRSTAQQTPVERQVQPGEFARSQPVQREAQVDPKAQTWAEKNEWFGSDKLLTAAAMAIHSTLVEDEGFDPTSDEYYSEVDRRMRREFPQRFKSSQSAAPARVASAAASASKAAVQGRRSVKLTASQVAMAKRLNVPLEEYAKYVKD